MRSIAVLTAGQTDDLTLADSIPFPYRDRPTQNMAEMGILSVAMVNRDCPLTIFIVIHEPTGVWHLQNHSVCRGNDLQSVAKEITGIVVSIPSQFEGENVLLTHSRMTLPVVGGSYHEEIPRVPGAMLEMGTAHEPCPTKWQYVVVP